MHRFCTSLLFAATRRIHEKFRFLEIPPFVKTGVLYLSDCPWHIAVLIPLE